MKALKIVLVLAVLYTIAFVIYWIYRFVKFINSGTWQANATMAIIVACFVIGIYMIEGTRRSNAVKEKKKEEEAREREAERKVAEWRRKKVEIERQEAREREWRRTAEIAAAINSGVCLKCKKPASDLDSDALCGDCQYRWWEDD